MTTENKEFLIRMTSHQTGKCCDLYPPMGVFRVRETDKGKEVVTRRESIIPDAFEFEILPDNTATKACPYCKTDYLENEQFISSNQKGDEPMCLVCFERRYVTGDKYAYREVIRRQLMEEMLAGGETKDSNYEKALMLVLKQRQCSAPFIQRKLNITFAQAINLVKQLEDNGVVGPFTGSQHREILINP